VSRTRMAEGYAKLVGANAEYVLTHLETILGRETTSRKYTPTENFVPVGVAKNISRNHASIMWQVVERQWVLMVGGKNGIEVDGVFCAPTEDSVPKSVVLKDKSRITVEGNDFFFLLPVTDQHSFTS